MSIGDQIRASAIGKSCFRRLEIHNKHRGAYANIAIREMLVSWISLYEIIT